MKGNLFQFRGMTRGMTRIAATGMIGLVGTAYAAPTEVLVRYRTAQDALPSPTAEIINADEGLVKLKFPSESAARAEVSKLLNAPEVEEVTPNVKYKPAFHLQTRELPPEEVAEITAPATHFFSGFVSAMAARTFAAAVPPVLPAPKQRKGTDALLSKDWALSAIRLKSQDQNFLVTRSITAAVIDTGVDYNHEDLAGAMWRKPGAPKEVGFDFAHNTATPYDVRHFDMEGCMKDPLCSSGFGSEKFMSNPGHGTHCAGHVAAVANNQKGIRGVGAGAKIMALKFFYDKGEPNAGQGDDAAAIKSIDYAVKNGARVISASWGGRMTREVAEKSELKKALLRARAAGVLIVIAAGNDSIDQDVDQHPAFPAAYTDLDNVIVVAASDQKDALASFSNYGARSVHIAAPGVKILSTTTESQYSDIVARFTDRGGRVQEIGWDGTSMATPIVAGAAALVWSKNPSLNYLQVKEKLLSSVRHVPALEGKVLTAGVLDVSAALNR